MPSAWKLLPDVLLRAKRHGSTSRSGRRHLADSELLRQFDSRRAHAWNKLRWSIPPEHRRGRLLDIGCGCGNALVAALQHGFDAAVGLDRSFEEFSWFKVQDFDALCAHFGVDAARATLIEADLFGISLQPQAFSCVLMLDSIEHVPDPGRFIQAAARYVAPGGVSVHRHRPAVLLQAGPSPLGFVPAGRLPVGAPAQGLAFAPAQPRHLGLVPGSVRGTEQGDA